MRIGNWGRANWDVDMGVRWDPRKGTWDEEQREGDVKNEKWGLETREGNVGRGYKVETGRWGGGNSGGDWRHWERNAELWGPLH